MDYYLDKPLTLDQEQHRLKSIPDKYELIDTTNGQYFRNIFPYTEVPKIPFNDRYVPMKTPKEVWITDTSFRDGQQSRPPYSVEQIVDLYKFLSQLGGKKGIIKQTEFFLYSKKDKEAVRKCQELDYKFPEITGWVRATKSDFALVKEMGLKESGILTSVSDYHIFKKLKITRKQALDKYLGIVKDALEAGIKPRCHFEDITRADFNGFVIPFAHELMKLQIESGVPIKIRACDTLGLGVSYRGTSLPRSVPGIIYALREYSNVPSEQLEWHGHNDFYKALTNAANAWLFGCAAVNCSLLGIGERTGNTPLEGMCIEYTQLFGRTDGMDFKVITKIRNYMEKYTNTFIPNNMPFVGKDFNTTRAGIHADGLMKDEEIYNIFDTTNILNRKPEVVITDKSGAAGICAWINVYFNLEKDKEVTKNNPAIGEINKWIMAQYDEGRITGISEEEMIALVQKYIPEIYKEMVITKQLLEIKTND